MNINLHNQTVYFKNVRVTDDNDQERVIFDDRIDADQSVEVEISTSEAGYGDIHYSVDGGDPVGAQLLNEGDIVSV